MIEAPSRGRSEMALCACVIVETIVARSPEWRLHSPLRARFTVQEKEFHDWPRTRAEAGIFGPKEPAYYFILTLGTDEEMLPHLCFFAACKHGALWTDED